MTRQRTTFQPGDEILAEIADLLIEQNRLLCDIRDRLPEPSVAGQPDQEPGPVEVSEPAPKRVPGKQADPGAEPAPEPVPVSEPARKTASPKKATAARRRH